MKIDKDQLSDLTEKVVLATFADNEDSIVKGLAKGLAWEDGWEKTLMQAIYNTAKISTRLSVQAILEILLGTGAFTISEELTRPRLTVLRGGPNHEPHET